MTTLFTLNVIFLLIWPERINYFSTVGKENTSLINFFLGDGGILGIVDYVKRKSTYFIGFTT